MECILKFKLLNMTKIHSNKTKQDNQNTSVKSANIFLQF